MTSVPGAPGWQKYFSDRAGTYYYVHKDRPDEPSWIEPKITEPKIDVGKIASFKSDSGVCITGRVVANHSEHTLVAVPGGHVESVHVSDIMPGSQKAFSESLRRLMIAADFEEPACDEKPSKRRKSENGWKSTDHYNKKAEQHGRLDAASRIEDPSFPSRAWHNVCKTVLLEATLAVWGRRQDLNVIDLCIGRGSDMHKLREATHTHGQKLAVLIGVDSAKQALKICRERSTAACQKTWCANKDFLEADLSNADDPWVKAILNSQPHAFHIVSSQLALHYFASSRATMMNFMEIVAACAIPDGLFCCSYTDGSAIVRAMRQAIKRDQEENGTLYPPRGGITFTRGDVTISMERNCIARADGLNPETLKPDSKAPFGIHFNFSLGDVITNSKEYLVHEESFKSIARSYGLECVLSVSFRDLITAIGTKGQTFQQIVHRMNAPYTNGKALDTSVWDAAAFYKVAVFSYKPSKDIETLRKWISGYMLGK